MEGLMAMTVGHNSLKSLLSRGRGLGEQGQVNDRGLTSTEVLFHQEGVQWIEVLSEAACFGRDRERSE